MRRGLRALLVVAAGAGLVPAAGGYIHFPPPTLQKMCAISSQARLLKVERVSPDGEVVLFGVEEVLKGGKEFCPPGKHVLRRDAGRVARDALKPGTQAVMFWIDAPNIGCAYVFLERQCYSADYNVGGKYWLLIRDEPEMAGCYYGPPDRLAGLVRDVLAGKAVDVPVKAVDRPGTKADWERRFKEVTDVLKKNRNLPE